MTMRVTPPKRPASKTPEASPVWAKISPTSPRGTMPTPIDRLVAAEPERGIAGGQLAGDADDDQHAADEQSGPARRLERIEGAQVDRRPDRDEEQRHEEMADLGDAALDLV